MIPIRILLTAIVDYAGLFPPSGLAMQEVVRNFAAYTKSNESWMLSRLIVPVSRIEEFERESAGLLPSDPNDEPWSISALIGKDLDADIDAIFEFNQRHADNPEAGLAVIDNIELRADGPRCIDRAMTIIPEQLTPFFELPPDDDTRGLIAALAGTGASAKIRCGGVTPDLFPSSERIADFITHCAAAGVPFKATAGLHHPVRAEQNLTYDPDPPRHTMHGFLNVFIAAALIRHRVIDRDKAVALIEETDTSTFQFTDEAVSWRDYAVDSSHLAAVRESFAISFGSCSFEEPVADLKAIRALA